jgi:hypothetical protein
MISRLRWSVLAACAAIGLGCVTPAPASVIAFDNSGAVFQWRPSGFAGVPGNGLDPSLAADHQASAVVSRSLGYSYGFIAGSDMAVPESIFGGLDISIARNTIPVIVHNGFEEFDFFPATTFAAGQPVGSAANWQSSANAAWNSFFAGRNRLLGQEAFVGFRINLADGSHYGFIDLNWQQAPPDFGSMMMYQPLAWAYESVPNTPITVPAPAFAAAIVCGAWLMGRRRSV